jgi:hypothetical protein
MTEPAASASIATGQPPSAYPEMCTAWFDVPRLSNASVPYVRLIRKIRW